jgi:hypothetical protein
MPTLLGVARPAALEGWNNRRAAGSYRHDLFVNRNFFAVFASGRRPCPEGMNVSVTSSGKDYIYHQILSIHWA